MKLLQQFLQENFNKIKSGRLFILLTDFDNKPGIYPLLTFELKGSAKKGLSNVSFCSSINSKDAFGTFKKIKLELMDQTRSSSSFDQYIKSTMKHDANASKYKLSTYKAAGKFKFYEKSDFIFTTPILPGKWRMTSIDSKYNDEYILERIK